MNEKAQMKVQEMAFVLIAIILFFGMVALVYFSIRLSSLREDVTALREQSAKELSRKLADIPEFSWTSSTCSGCIDMDKVLAMKGREVYRGFWDLDYLMVERVFPNNTNIECTRGNYPDCGKITLINNTQYFGSPPSAFVALCRVEPSKGGYTKCEMGKIHAASRVIK